MMFAPIFFLITNDVKNKEKVVLINRKEETGIKQEFKVVFNKFNFLWGWKLEARHKSAAKYTDALQYFIDLFWQRSEHIL